MISFLRRLAFGCLWDHSYVKDLSCGKLRLLCTSCGASRVVLPKQKLKVKKEGKIITLRSRRSWSQVPAKHRLKA